MWATTPRRLNLEALGFVVCVESKGVGDPRSDDHGIDELLISRSLTIICINRIFLSATRIF